MRGNNSSWLSRTYSRLTTPKRNYPVVDAVIAGYCGFVLFVQILLQISPVMTFLAKTPLYSIQTYLGLLGGALIVVDLFTTKRIWQGKYSILLYAILLLAALASVRMISYGTKENLFKLCWMSVQFVLMYSCAYRMDRDTLRKYAKALFYVLLLIWFVGCCVSLYQYVNQIGYRYVVNPLAKDSSINRQGFYDNRLFGIFYTLNHAAYISLFFFIIAIVCMVREKHIWAKIGLGIAEFALLCHIVLSYSRSAMVSLIACAAVMPWFVARNMLKIRGALKPVICCAVSIAVAVLCYFGYTGLKSGLVQVPYLKQLLVYNMQKKDDETAQLPTKKPATDSTNPSNPTDLAPEETLDATIDPSEAPTEATTATEATTDPTTAPGTDASDPTAEPGVPPTKKPMEKPTNNEDILSREYLEEDVSNDRFEIWADYIHLYKEVGLMGLSPGNYMPYILENHADMYIVDYIKENYPSKYESGIIYHVHNGYMMVYVSAGIVGFLCLALFILLYLIRLIAVILKNKKLSGLFIGAFALVVAGALSAIFDEGLFFQNNPHTTMFWLALGVLMREYHTKADTIVEVDSQEENPAEDASEA